VKYTIRPSGSTEAVVRDRRLEAVKHLRRIVLLCIFASVVLSIYTFRTDMVEAYTAMKARSQIESMAEADIERIYFEPDSTNLYSLYNYNLTVLNHGTLKMYTPAGSELLSLQLGFSRPALAVGDTYVAAYDRGNKSIIITGQTSLVDTIEEEGGIISVDQNDAGFLAVTRDDDYYRSVVNVYDNSQNLIYQWKTSDYYLLRAVLSPDSKHIAVAALTQDGGEFQSKIIFFDLSREEFGASYVMDGSLATNMYFLDNEKLCIIGDNRAAVIDTLGLEVCVYEYGNDMLKTYASGSDCVVLALTDRTSGLGSKLVTISASTDKPIIRSTDDAVRKLSVSGDYIAVLYTQSTEVYNKELKPYGQPVEVYGVRDLLINDEGKVLLIYSSEAGYVDFITPFLSHENASAIK